MSSWLSKQKKPELQALSEQAGLKGTSHMNKTDLINALETRLRDQAVTLSKIAAFESFYNTGRANSPLKREPAAVAVAVTAPDAPEPEVKKSAAPRRRTTNAASSSTDASSPTAKSLLPARTPSSVERVARSVPLPASPQAVADLVERQSAVVSRSFNNVLKATGADDALSSMRENLSSVHAITTLFILVEAYALQRVTLPLRHAFNVPIPFANVLGVASPYRVLFPDFFVMLTAHSWNPTLLWLTIALLGPALIGFLFNISRAAAVSHRRSASKLSPVDPVAFNIARGLLAWLVFVNRYTAMGFISPRTVTLVEASLWGGSNAVIVTSAIAATAGIYEAILRKS